MQKLNRKSSQICVKFHFDRYFETSVFERTRFKCSCFDLSGLNGQVT